MQELLLVNPRRRRKASAKKRRSRRRSPAQRAAFLKMIGARSSNPKRRRRRASGSKRRARRSLVSRIMGNPRRRSRRSGRRSSARRRNPISLGSAVRHPFAVVGPALTGAVGAVVVNQALARLPVPPMLMTGKVRYLTQAAAAILLGSLAARFVGSGRAAAAVAGALTITAYDALRDVAAGAGVNLSGMGYYLPGAGVQAVPSASGNPGAMAGMRGVSAYLTGPGSPRGNVVPMNRGGMGRIGRVGTFGF